MHGLRVVDLEPATQERVVELERRAGDDRGALRVDQDAEAEGVDDVVISGGGLFERELVAEAGAAAREDPDAQAGLVVALT